MRWTVATVFVALAAVVAVNVLLLSHVGGAGGRDPVGRLTPVAPAPATTTGVPPTPRPAHFEDD